MKVLLACNNRDISDFLESVRVEYSTVTEREKVIPSVISERPDVLIIEDTLPGRTDMLELLQEAAGYTRVILHVDRFENDEVTLRCVKQNCAILPRNFNFAELERMLFGNYPGVLNPVCEPAQKPAANNIRSFPSRLSTRLPGRKSRHRLPNLVVVYSPVSAGKTFTAVNLAACAAQSGRSVALVDLDVSQSSCALWLNVPPGREVLAQALSDPGTPGYQLQMPSGLTVYSPAPDRPPVIDRERLANLLGSLSQRNNLVVVDTPRDLDPVLASYLFLAASKIVVVTDLDYARLIILHGKLKTLKNLIDYNRVVLVANRVTTNKKVTVSDVERAGMVKCRCVIPDVPAPVLEGIYAGKPPALFVPGLKVLGELLEDEQKCGTEISATF
ncbi:MAG: hypothetical protein PWP72_966 [Thermoanaerobacter sp.]|nr:hypothetical protein [Thermoanaerobacter sp.]